MKLVVGLGNPLDEYKNTRHNIGYMLIDNYLGDVLWKNKFNSEIYIKEINNDKVLFLKPKTFMNMSGLAVAKAVSFYKININDILIIQDDLDLPKFSYKIKRNSSSGGHNGIKSIINELKTDKFARLKIGIDKDVFVPRDKYVLSKFSKEELDIFEHNINIYKDIINEFIINGIEKTLAKYNKH